MFIHHKDTIVTINVKLIIRTIRHTSSNLLHPSTAVEVVLDKGEAREPDNDHQSPNPITGISRKPDCCQKESRIHAFSQFLINNKQNKGPDGRIPMIIMDKHSPFCNKKVSLNLDYAQLMHTIRPFRRPQRLLLCFLTAPKL